MKYFSLFSGIGGFELGIQLAHEDTKSGADSKVGRARSSGQRRRNLSISDNSDPSWPVCVGYSEIDRYANDIYKKHFPDHKNYGDITKIDARDLPDFELLCGGFPCQSFSIAGKRHGFNDTRGTLFFDIARIAKEKQPRLLLLENVRGLLSHDEGRTFTTIIATLDELGYDLQWQVLNSKNHGVPQNRERIIIVGHLRGSARPEVFPIGTGAGVCTQPRAESQEEIAPCLGAARGGADINDQFVRHTVDGFHLARKDKKRSSIQGTHVTLEKGKTHALSTAHKPMVLKGEKIRRLTPVECERLQGFPDGWTEGMSDTQRYKMLGNAVTVNVIRDVVLRILLTEK